MLERSEASMGSLAIHLRQPQQRREGNLVQGALAQQLGLVQAAEAARRVTLNSEPSKPSRG